MRNKFDEISMHMEEKWDILSSAVMLYWIHSPDRSQFTQLCKGNDADQLEAC